jgi:hypothetical protein
MGLQLFKSSQEPDLGNSNTLAILSLSGTLPAENDLLIMQAKGFLRTEIVSTIVDAM